MQTHNPKEIETHYSVLEYFYKMFAIPTVELLQGNKQQLNTKGFFLLQG